MVAGLGIGTQHHGVEVGHRVAALHIAGEGVQDQAVDGVFVHGEQGQQGGVAHRTDDKGVELAHQDGVGVIPALEAVAVLGGGGQGVGEEVLHRVGAGHGTHRVAVALVVLHGEHYIIYIGVETDAHGAVLGHLDHNSVGNQIIRITQIILSTLSILPAGHVVAGQGGGSDAHGAVGHDDVAAGDGVVGDVQLAGDGVDDAHQGVNHEGQHIGVVKEVALQFHVAVDAEAMHGLRRDDGAVGYAVCLSDLGPVHKVVVGGGCGRQAQVGVGHHGVAPLGDVVAHAVGQRGFAGDAEGARRGHHHGSAFEDAVDIEVVAGGVFGDHAVATLDLQDVAGFIPVVGQRDALGFDDTGAGDGVAMVAREVDTAHGGVVHRQRDHGVRGKGGCQRVVLAHGDARTQRVDNRGVIAPTHQVVAVGGNGTHRHGAVGQDIVAVAVGSVDGSLGQRTAVMDGELVDLQVVHRRTLDGHMVGVQALDRTVLVVRGGGNDTFGTAVNTQVVAHQVGTVGDMEIHLRDAGVRDDDVDVAHAALDEHTVRVGTVGLDADGTAADVLIGDAEERHAVLRDDELHRAAFVVGEGQLVIVQVEHGFGGGVARHGERQGRVSREERFRLCDEEAIVDDVGGGVGHAVLVHPVGHMVQLGGVGLDGHLGTVVNAVGDGVNLGDAGGGGGDVKFDVGSIRTYLFGSCVRIQIVRVGVLVVIMIGENLAGVIGIVEVFGGVVGGVLVECNHQVARAVILKRGTEGDGRPAIFEGHITRIDNVGSGHSFIVGAARECAARHVLHVDNEVVGLRPCRLHLVADRGDGTGRANLLGSIQRLDEGVSIQ